MSTYALEWTANSVVLKNRQPNYQSKSRGRYVVPEAQTARLPRVLEFRVLSSDLDTFGILSRTSGPDSGLFLRRQRRLPLQKNVCKVVRNDRRLRRREGSSRLGGKGRWATGLGKLCEKSLFSRLYGYSGYAVLCRIVKTDNANANMQHRPAKPVLSQ